MVFTLDQARLNPLSLELTLEGINIYERSNHEPPLLSLASFNTKIMALPLFKGEIVATHLTVDTFDINITRNNDGNYNFRNSIQDKQSHSLSNILNFSNLPFRFSLSNISLNDGKITFTDKPSDNIHLIEDISLTLPNLSNFSFQAKEYIHPSFSAVINGSPFQLTGQADLTGNGKGSDIQLHTELSCDFKNIELNRYFEYLPLNLPFNITHGKAAGALKLKFSQSDNNTPLSVAFSLHTTDMLISSNYENFKIHAPSAKLEGFIQPLTATTQLRNIELQEPTFYVSSKFSFTDFHSLINLTENTTSPSNNNPTEATIIIDHLVADKGRIVFTDETLTSERDRWQSIRFSLSNYSNTGERNSLSTPKTTFQLSGKLNDSNATLSWQGHLDKHLLPAGDLLLREIPATNLLPFLGLDKLGIKEGVVDAQAYLSFTDYPNISLSDRICIAEGNLAIKDLILTENNHTWYSTPIAKITGLSKEGKKVSLGSLYLKKSTLQIQTDALPTLIRRIGGENGNIGIEALDYSGSLVFSNGPGKLPNLEFNDVSLQAINLSRLESSSERDNLTFTAKLGENGIIQAKGKVRLNSFITTLTTGFSGIDSSVVLPWFGKSALNADIKTTLAGKGAFSFPYVSFQGHLLLEDGTLSEKERPYLSWKTIELKNFRYNREPIHLGATECTWVAPKTSWEYTNDGPQIISALSNSLNKYFPQPDDPSRDYSKLPLLELGQTTVTLASINITDSRLTPSWQNTVTNLSGTIEQISSNATTKASPYSFTGQLSSSPFTLSGEANLFNLRENGTAQFVMNDFPLASLHESVAKQLELNSNHGDLSLELNRDWNKDRTVQTATLYLQNLRPLTATSGSALVLALLADHTNSFSLSLESEEKPGKVLPALTTQGISAFKKKNLKVAVSPLLLASDNFSDLIGREYAEFHPGQILLTEEGQQSLARFSNLMSAYPNIGMTITGSADTVIDAEAMKIELENAEELRVTAENLNRTAELEQATAEYLRQAAEKHQVTDTTSAIVELQIPNEIYSRYAPITPQQVVIDNTMLKNLASMREKVIINFLIENLQLAPERISLAKEPVITSDIANPGNRVFFTIGSYDQP